MKPKLPPFVMIRKDLLKDQEWQSLSSSAKIIYIYLRSKFNKNTLSEVSLTYSETKGLMASETASNAFKELETKGFIEKNKKGGLYGGVTTYKFIGQYADFIYKGVRV